MESRGGALEASAVAIVVSSSSVEVLEVVRSELFADSGNIKYKTQVRDLRQSGPKKQTSVLCELSADLSAVWEPRTLS